jgi:hypothetical protein
VNPGLYSSIKITPDRKQFTIEVHFVPGGQVGNANEHLILGGYAENRGYSCSVSRAQCQAEETLVGGSCIGSLAGNYALNDKNVGGGQVGVGPFLMGGNPGDDLGRLYQVECRGTGQSITALAVCMRNVK